jgi:hypothetical protein
LKTGYLANLKLGKEKATFLHPKYLSAIDKIPYKAAKNSMPNAITKHRKNQAIALNVSEILFISLEL